MFNQSVTAVDWSPSLTLIQSLLLGDNTESDLSGNISDEVRRLVDLSPEKNMLFLFFWFS